MKTLSREAQMRARAFIFEHGRPLEQARYVATFEHGSVEMVWEALTAFRNADGGFGHGLESDLQLADSSVLATTVGLQVLRECGATSDHPLVKGAMGYLISTYDAEFEVWPIIPPNSDDAPHAPWWLYEENIAEKWGDFQANPRAEIVGYLHDYAELVPPALRDHLTGVQLRHLEDQAETLAMHDLLCYVRFAESARLPAELRAELVRMLNPVVDRTIVTDPDAWWGYGLAPVELVEGPDSLFAALLADTLSTDLDFEISRQSANGAWEPKWSWGDAYPEAWDQAKRDWSGVLTLRILSILKRFGRLEA